MAEFDEYEYLEKNLDKEEAQENGSGIAAERSSKRDRRRRSRERRSSRERRRRRERSRSYSPHKRRSRGRREERRKRHTPSPKYSGGARTGGQERWRRRERTPPEVKAAKERERELRELEKDTRTIFAYNLNLKADERDLFDFFSKAGKVTDVKIIMDRNTRKSKGFAYIEFDKQEDVLNALTLTGQLLLGQAVMVKASEAEKNLAWEAQQQQQQNQAAAAALLGTNLSASGPCKLYVAGLHPDITQNDLKRIFSPFGDVDSVQLATDSNGVSQSYGYVQFSRMQDATKAMQQLNGLEIGGSAIRVQIASVAAGDMGAVTYGELDEEDEMGGGMKLSSHARAALMNRLANSAGLQTGNPFNIPGTGATGMPGMASATGTAANKVMPSPLTYDQGVLGPASPRPTQCLLIKNMFDASEESAPNWVGEIEQDVTDECTKYGGVVHIHADPKSKGFVYLKFSDIQAAVAAQKALHGRWFAGRQIVVEYQFLQIYNNHFQC